MGRVATNELSLNALLGVHSILERLYPKVRSLTTMSDIFFEGEKGGKYNNGGAEHTYTCTIPENTILSTVVVIY